MTDNEIRNVGKKERIYRTPGLLRREFLRRSGQAAAASLLPAQAVRSLAVASKGVSLDYHFAPHYREHLPSESLLQKVTAGLDDFVTEKYHELVAAILDGWSASLRQFPADTQAFEKALDSDFHANSLRPSQTKSLRSGGLIEIERLSFPVETALGREAFLRELRQSLRSFRQILTADFLITGIEEAAGELRTRVRYEVVGEGLHFHREQRVGTWELRWRSNATNGYRLKLWRHMEELRSRSAAPVFEDVTVHSLGTNRSYTEQLAHGVDYWRTTLDGACGIDIYGHNGVSVGDVDSDGLDDLYVCQPAGLPNRLFRNRGDGSFEDVTEVAGVGVLENTACAIFADFHNTGHQDLLVVRANGPVFFSNLGNGKFEMRPDAFRFANAPQGTFTGAAAADYNRDGLLDIYFCLYVYYQGTDQYKYPTPYHDANNGPPNFLMRNNGDGIFRDVTAEAGLNQNNHRYSFCCGWTDFNQNSWPDLYVVNDFGRKNLYRNNGDGTFTDIAGETGVEDVGAGMSVCSFDYDNDGPEDLYVADMWTAAGERITSQDTFRKNSPVSIRAMYRKHAMGNSLFRNNGNGAFEDKTSSTGVGVGRWAWASDAWDFDHDGFSDLYITNGMVSGPLRNDLNSFFWRQVVANSPDEAKPSQAYEQSWNAVNELIRADHSWSGYERNVFYANNRDGSFSDVSGVVGLDFMEDGRSFALSDFDGDGRLELFLKNRNGPQLRVLKNTAKELPPSICFRLKGTKSNRDAIGATVTIETSQGRQTRTVQAGSGFLSQHSKDVFFGLGNARAAIRASIRWPSGLIQAIEGVLLNHRVHVTEGADEHRLEPFGSTPDGRVTPQAADDLPEAVETWLLAPVTAPDFSLAATNGTKASLSAWRGHSVFLYFWVAGSELCRNNLSMLDRQYRSWTEGGVQVVAINLDEPKNTPQVRQHVRRLTSSLPVLLATDEMSAIYNILYRSLFDRHRDLGLPASFLIDEKGEVVKVYRGPLQPDRLQQDFRAIPKSPSERLAKALPFPSNTATFAFGRNYLSIGSTYFQRGYFDQAGACFAEALRDNPASAEAHYGVGSVYLKQSKKTEARTSFEKAVAATASYPDTRPNAWNNLGLIAMQEERPDEAIGFFREALLLNPDHMVSLENLGNALRQEQRWDEALRVLEHAINVVPDNPEICYSLGMVFAQTDQPDRAYTYLQKALQLRPIYPEAMNNLGILYLRTKRRDEAVAQFEACIRAAPAFEQSYLNLARVHLIEGNREKAKAILLTLLKQLPGNVQAEKALKELQ